MMPIRAALFAAAAAFLLSADADADAEMPLDCFEITAYDVYADFSAAARPCRARFFAAAAADACRAVAAMLFIS